MSRCNRFQRSGKKRPLAVCRLLSVARPNGFRIQSVIGQTLQSRSTALELPAVSWTQTSNISLKFLVTSVFPCSFSPGCVPWHLSLNPEIEEGIELHNDRGGCLTSFRPLCIGSFNDWAWYFLVGMVVVFLSFPLSTFTLYVLDSSLEVHRIAFLSGVCAFLP
jgi:hypothetical protein